MVENNSEEAVTVKYILEEGKPENREKPFRFSSKTQMVEEVISSASEQHAELSNLDLRFLSQLALDCIEEIERLHNAPDLLRIPPDDIDVVWIIAAPGLLLARASRPGWSSNFPWLDDCERQVVGRGLNLVLGVTGRRLNKSSNQVTKKDVEELGPWIVYNSLPAEAEDVATLLTYPQIRIPREKVYLFDEITDDKGTVRKIENTADQAKSIHMPPGVDPRKIAICVLAAQWVRLGRLLAKTKTLPAAEVVVVPIASPKGHEQEHATMETRGALVNFFKLNRASDTPIKYST